MKDRLVFGTSAQPQIALFANSNRPSRPPPEVTPADYAAEDEMRDILVQVKLENKRRRRAHKLSSDSSIAPLQDNVPSVPPVICQNTEMHGSTAAQATTPTLQQQAEEFMPQSENNALESMNSAAGASSDASACEVSEDDSQCDSSRTPETVTDDIVDIARAAHRSKMPHVCLVGSANLGHTMLSEWLRFCKHAVKTRVLQRVQPSNFCADSVCIMVANRNGRFVLYDEEWTMWILRHRMSRAIYALALLDDSHSLASLDELPEGHSALVYDPLSPDSQDAMIASEEKAQYVIPLAKTSMNAPCVVRRSNQMLQTCKL